MMGLSPWRQQHGKHMGGRRTWWTQHSSLAELKFGESEVWFCLDILLIPGHVSLETLWEGEGVTCNSGKTHPNPHFLQEAPGGLVWNCLLGSLDPRSGFNVSLHRAHAYFC